LNMKIHIALLIFIVMLTGLAACGNQEMTPAAPERVVEETGAVETAEPTRTATPMPPTPTATATAVETEIAAEPQPFLAEEFDFELTIPPGYVVVEREHPDALLVVSLHEATVADAAQGHRPEIFVTVHDNPEQLNVRAWFATHTAETITDTYPIYVRPRLLQARPVAGRPALSFEDNTFAPTAVTLVEGDGYILALGYVPLEYPGLAEAFAELLASLAFGSAPPLTAVLPTPSSPPPFLCPGTEWPDAAWECRENVATGTRRCTAVDLERWLASAQRRSGPSLFPQTELNASVAGRPAAIWVDDCPSQYFSSVGLVFSDGRHIYWWWHFAFYEEAGMLPLRQMLDSLRFGEETAVPAEIPEEIWQEALQGCH
jgi:hypothetical protein